MLLLSNLQTRLAALFVAALLSACASPDPTPATGARAIRQGTIEQITPTQLQSSHHAGVGAIVGGLGGLGIGSLIGNGSGRDVAQVIGTVGGAIAGNEIQKRYDTPVPAQQVVVRTSSGVLVSITQPVVPGLRVGQAVYIEGNGEGARVVAQQ
jgi:outer membrane lipoprotein SlyB